METIILRGTDLASRKRAAVIRQEVEDALAHNASIRIDASETLSISDSYADELFGVLVLKLGLADVTQKIKVFTENNSVLRSVAVAMHRRANEQKAA